MRTQTTTVYKFDELSDEAKQTATNSNRYIGVAFIEWWDSSFEMFAEAAELFGLDIRQTRKSFVGGGHRHDPTIFFSGFSSQGDGACFEGYYAYKKGALKATKQAFPTDYELLRIVLDLQALQQRNFYQLTATAKHRGCYSHSGCMDIIVDRADGKAFSDDDEESLKQLMRDFADWIYSCLKKEHDYLHSDEAVAESLRANEVEFTEDGKTI